MKKATAVLTVLVLVAVLVAVPLLFPARHPTESFINQIDYIKMRLRKQQGVATISFYGKDAIDDNGIGFSGIDLVKMRGLTFNGKPVYPVAVHHDDAPDFMYKVLQIRGKGLRTIQGVVVDICNRKDASCNNRDFFGRQYAYANNFLIDIHKTGWAAIGKRDGLYLGQYKVIGEMRPRLMPRDVWTNGNETSIMCRCIGACDTAKSQMWRKLGDGAC